NITNFIFHIPFFVPGICVTCLRLKTKKIRKLNKFIGEYSFCTIFSRLNNGCFHVIYTDFPRHTTQLSEYSFHTIEKTFLVFSRQGYCKGTITKRQSHY